MATVNYTHACGHKNTLSSYSRPAARRQAEFFKHQPCRQCRWTVEHVTAADQARDAGLPALHDTYGQIAYAEVLRAKRLPELSLAIEAILDEGESLHPVLFAELERWCGHMQAEIHHRSSATAWIDGPKHIYDWHEWLQDKAQRTGVAPAPQAVITSVYGT